MKITDRPEWQEAVRLLVIEMTSGFTDDRELIPNDYEMAIQGLEAVTQALVDEARAGGGA